MKEKVNYIDIIDNGIKNGETDFVLVDILTYVRILSPTKDVNISTFTHNFKVIYDIYNYLIKNGYNVINIEINLVDASCITGEEEKSISFSEIDYRYLDRINKNIKRNNLNTSFNVIYDSDSMSASYDDFIGLSECIKWYRSLIKESDLTPFEKLIYAYDICKTIEYQRSGESYKDIDNDNTIHLFVKTGNIVCLGYNRLLKEILSDIDDNINFCEFLTEVYEDGEEEPECHSRGFVKLEDDVYDIKGFYALDVTWDSVHDKFKQAYGEEYDALSGYRFFLVPITKYRRFFKGDTFPRLFNNSLYRREKYLTATKLDKMIHNKKTSRKVLDKEECIIGFEFESLIDGKMTYKEFLEYLNCKRPDLDTFVSAIIMVRRAEGYDIDSFNHSLVYGISPEDKDKGIVFDVSEDVKKLIL